MKNIGDLIKKIMEDKKINVEDLGFLLDMYPNQVYEVINGRKCFDDKTLKKISVLFKIDYSILKKLNVSKEQKIVKLVLTGGPCAGKTTAMSWIQSNFEKQGYKVMFIPETATELITGGLAPWDLSTAYDYQKMVFKDQITKEDIYMECAKKMGYDKILIVCDRGLMDNKAYMNEEEYQRVLRDFNISKSKIMDRYDVVFHLVSAAKGAEEYYNLDNEARTETVEQASMLDDKIINAWTGHPHFRIIDNSCDFEDKMKRLMKEISCVLGEPEPLEIERKFLIEKPDLDYLDNLDSCCKVNIVQTYLKSNNPNEEVRIRQRGINGSYTYSKTRKINIDGLKRIEIESRLTQEEYIEELANADLTRKQIIKTRYCLSYNNQYFEIDIFPDMENEAIMEIELSKEDEKIKIPEFINVIEEVTDREEYKNSNMAKRLVKKQLV